MTNKHGLSQIIWICPPGGGRGVKQGSPRAWWTKGSRRWTLQSGVSLADCPPMSFSIVCWQGLPPPTQQIKIQLQTSWGGRYNRGWAETSNGEKVWISKLFDTMNKLWKEEKAKVGDIFDNRNSGIIWKSRLLWWCIIDRGMIHNHIDALGKYGNSVEGVILKEGLCVNLDWWDGGPGAGKERESLHQETHFGDKPAIIFVFVFLEQSWWMRLWLKWTAPFSWVRFTRAAPGNHHQ